MCWASTPPSLTQLRHCRLAEDDGASTSKGIGQRGGFVDGLLLLTRFLRLPSSGRRAELPSPAGHEECGGPWSPGDPSKQHGPRLTVLQQQLHTNTPRRSLDRARHPMQGAEQIASVTQVRILSNTKHLASANSGQAIGAKPLPLLPTATPPLRST